MSAYVIDIETMDTVVRAICVQWGRRERSIRRFADETISDCHAFDRIGRKLYAMNLDAVQQRYPDTIDNPNGIPGPCDMEGNTLAPQLAERYRYSDGKFSSLTNKDMIASYKAMGSLLYQCAEGNVPQSSLHAELSGLRDRLAHEIVTALPEYEAAPWG